MQVTRAVTEQPVAVPLGLIVFILATRCTVQCSWSVGLDYLSIKMQRCDRSALTELHVTFSLGLALQAPRCTVQQALIKETCILPALEFLGIPLTWREVQMVFGWRIQSSRFCHHRRTDAFWKAPSICARNADETDRSSGPRGGGPYRSLPPQVNQHTYD